MSGQSCRAVVFAYHNVGVSPCHGGRSLGAGTANQTPMLYIREMRDE